MSVSIYIIGPVDGPFKIGIAGNVAKRLTNLQISTHTELLIHAARLCASREEALRLEGAAHEALAKHRIRGEWFRCPLEAAISSIGCHVGSAASTKHKEREAANYAFLMDGFLQMSEDARCGIAALYEINDSSPEALARHRTAEIMDGKISPQRPHL